MSVFQSKWGYHPCSKETCEKLKEAHLLFLRALRDIRAMERWERKREAKGEAPKYPSFVCGYGYFYRSRKAQEEGRLFYGYTATCGESLSWGNCQVQFYERLLEQYRKARRPAATPEEVEPLDLPDNFWEMVEKLKGFYGLTQPVSQSDSPAEIAS